MKNQHTQKVSIITVSLNAGSDIERAIKSVHSQSYPNIEHIIIDGGSTDGTLDIIKKYLDDTDYFVSEADNGIYHAMNKGIKAATGDVLFFLNSDDYFVDVTVVEDIINCFLEKPDVDIVFGNLIFEVGENKVHKKQPPEITRKYLGKTTILHQSVFAKRGVFRLTGNFSEDYKVVSDYEWMLKVFLKNRCKYLYCDRDIAVVSTRGLSSTTAWEAERISVMREYFNYYELVLRY
jgi:glycosyltransferase involved in cell wall biosynthesis